MKWISYLFWNKFINQSRLKIFKWNLDHKLTYSILKSSILFELNKTFQSLKRHGPYNAHS